MLKYKKYDSEVANAALDKFLNHTWYLNQELVPFSLFSKNVSDREKAEIAKKLTKVIPPKKYAMEVKSKELLNSEKRISLEYLNQCKFKNSF